MTRWKFAELNKLCEEKGISDAKIYQNSLNWRWKRADYHAKMASKVWADLFKESFSFVDQRCYEAIFSYEAQVESCVQALHSLGDILAQIINVFVLNSRFMEDRVSIKIVVGVMEKENLAPEMAKSTRKLLDDHLFNYIEAFCNTIKHRRLIKTEFRAEYGENARNESGLRFEEFIFKGNTYPQTWGSDIIEKYRFHILDLITDVGLNINKYIATI
ncbi:hypothetical protein ACFLZE_02460 [Thermodesulfobacteriota bacterium]